MSPHVRSPHVSLPLAPLLLQVYACGFGSKGVLGTGDSNPQLVPVPLTHFDDCGLGPGQH